MTNPSLPVSAFMIYLAGVIVVWVAVLISLRTEPTAHGQIVGRQVGCAVAVLWPAVLVYLAIVLPIALPLIFINWLRGEYR